MASDYLTPEELLAAAELGNKLKPKQRLAVVVWLEKNGKLEEYPEKRLASILQCKAPSIRSLRQRARAELAKAISTEEAMNYMADFVRSYDLMIAECKEQIKANKGTGLHQGYIRLLKELEAEKVDKLQSIGVIPKELGRLTAVTEEWTAEVSEEGVASVRNTSEGSDES